jgi:hypothetical protein
MISGISRRNLQDLFKNQIMNLCGKAESFFTTLVGITALLSAFFTIISINSYLQFTVVMPPLVATRLK